MGTATIPLEWFFETLNKRVGPPYNIPLKELFLIVPYPEEAEFDFEFPNIFKSSQTKFGVSQGNALKNDYPYIAKLLLNENKVQKIKVFFVHPSRLQSCLILWTRKYKYPKVGHASIRSPLIYESPAAKQAYVEHAIKQSLLIDG